MEITQGVHLHFIQSEKFKDIGISLRFLSPLTAKSATTRSLLAIMMVDRSNAFPTKKAMSDQQDLLYGATLHTQTVGYGKSHVIEIRSKIIDPIYVEEGSQLLQDTFAYVKEVILHPYLTAETLTESKKVLASKIIRMRDNPSHYASSQGCKLGGMNTPLAISTLGELDILEKLTLEDVQACLEEMIQNNRIDILVCGRCIEQEVQTILHRVFAFSPRTASMDTYYAMDKEPSKEIVYEYRDITQSSVFMLWSTHILICEKSYTALRLGCAMFGQYPSSLLFQEVREKHSLCYSISANLISFDGAMGVSTGVEKKDVKQVIALIQEQFERICHGDVSEALLTTTKTMMINSLYATKDSMSSLMAQAYQNAVLNQSLQIQERIERIQAITLEDIQTVFQACKQQFIFVVSKEDEDEENSK